MTNTLKLKAAIIQSGLTREEIAGKMGVSCFTLHKKMHNITEFKASEIVSLCDLLNLAEKDSIFFD